MKREFVMEQYLKGLPMPPTQSEAPMTVQPSIWLLPAEEMPPILFTTDEVARLLGVGRSRVYDLIRQRELRSVRVGASRRVSARALCEYVANLELDEPA
jgi:excisionase family DNA binding protein